MNLLLTHGYFLEDDAKEQVIMRPYPPLGILYISTYLENEGIANEVYDTTFSSKLKFNDYLLTNRPKHVAFYVNLMTKLNVLASIKFIKQNLPDSKIILGGPEVTHSIENFLNYGADFIVIGEGEVTMAELINELHGGSNELEKICGIAYIKDGAVTQTKEREKLKDLDILGLPNRKKINLQLYLNAWKERHGKNTISVSTMRGCPYTCKWCSRAVYGLSYRRRSPEKVAEELAYLKQEYNPDSLWFVDDVFTVSHKWLKSFAEELKKKDCHIPYECITRADRMNEDAVKLLKETGCFRVWIGAESGSQKVIDLMDRRVDVNQVRDMIKLTKLHGIEAGTFIMLGYPGETEEDIEETITHLKESNPDHFTITVAYPIKGTELYQEVEAIKTTNLDWAESTDRQIDFKRTYSRRYYDFAVKRVVHEVNYFKHPDGYTGTKLKVKSILAKIAMRFYASSLILEKDYVNKSPKKLLTPI